MIDPSRTPPDIPLIVMGTFILPPPALVHRPSWRLGLDRNPARSVEGTDEQIRTGNVSSRRNCMETEMCEDRCDKVHACNTRQLVGSCFRHTPPAMRIGT